ncbi:glycosyltransferase [bacterium]|nr:glycosyltransferase [bacterium]
MVPRRVLYTINRMEVGGSQTHLLQVLRLIDRERFEPLLCCLTGKGSLLDAARATGATVIDGGVHRLRAPSTLAAIARLQRFMRRERIDVVHNYLLRANVVGTLAARAARVPVVLTSKRGCHERHGYEMAGARLSNRLADCVTANADAVRDFVHGHEGCPREKMVVIPSGIDTERFTPLPPGDYKTRLGVPAEAVVVGSLTRMRVRKGVEEFLRAMAAICAERPAVHVVIAGDVTLDAELQALVDATGLGDRLHLLGRRSDVPEVLSAFDLFVLSSHDEGMSNAILEAMAMERPVVATAVGGTVEVVGEGTTGHLVPARDADALARGIRRVLDDRERGRAMGARGRQVVVDRFSAQAMVRQMEALYSRLLAARAAGQPATAALSAAT